MQDQPEPFRLGQQMGELIAEVRELNKQFFEMKGEQAARHAENTKKASDNLDQLTRFKHQQANHDQQVESRLGGIEKNAKNLEGEVSKLRKPVDQIVALRGRIGLFFTALLFLGGAVWFFLQPVWTFFYARVVSKFFADGH